MTTDLVTWLRRQLVEDEREIAKHPDDADYMGGADLLATEESNYPCHPFLQVSKKRALDEVDAKRRILDAAFRYEATIDGEWACCHSAEEIMAGECRETRPDDVLVVRLLALPYADRPGYRKEWRP